MGLIGSDPLGVQLFDASFDGTLLLLHAALSFVFDERDRHRAACVTSAVVQISSESLRGVVGVKRTRYQSFGTLSEFHSMRLCTRTVILDLQHGTPRKDSKELSISRFLSSSRIQTLHHGFETATHLMLFPLSSGTNSRLFTRYHQL